MTQALVTPKPTHRALLNGNSLLVALPEQAALLSEFITGEVAKGANPGELKVEAYDAPALTLVQAPKLEVGEYDVIGDARAQVDRDAAIKAGFAPSMPIYRQGSRATGMQRHRAAFDRLPLAKDAARALVRQVVAEERLDVDMEKTNVTLGEDGRLVDAGGATLLGDGPIPLNDRAFKQLVNRLDMPNGAGSYLTEVDPDLRAINVNRWVHDAVGAREQQRVAALRAARKTVDADNIRLRTRINEGQREAFAIVSDDYGTMDADVIGRAIEMAVEDGARASWAYDGQRTKFDVTYFSDINPKEAVAGEFFKAVVRVRSDDTGGGSCIITPGIFQNRCLNFAIIENAFAEAVRIRHLGDPRKLAAKFKEAFADAHGKIGHFVERWGYAARDEVTANALVMANAQGVLTRDEATAWVGRPAREVFAALFNGIIERDLVPALPKRDRTNTVQNLLTMVQRDDSFANRNRDVPTRATIVNAITRYAHEVNADPFKEHDIEAAATALLYPPSAKFENPAPLPFLPIGL